MKLKSLIVTAAIVTISTIAYALDPILCIDVHGVNYACHDDVYGGTRLHTGYTADFDNVWNRRLYLDAYYVSGCSASRTLTTFLEPGWEVTHTGADPAGRDVVYIWCGPDAWPDLVCVNGDYRPTCRGGRPQ